jgi:pimeloyl-ACP methyl ester carboxylesterase
MNIIKVAFTTTMAWGGLASAALPDQTKMDVAYLHYLKAGVFAKLANGDTIHVKCMGKGSPVVILTAGAGDWSATWRDVQPQIAKTTRVCAWDRPGFGFSSGSARPQTVANTTADLKAALNAARIRGPYILVGHSLGSYESLLLKDQMPHAVKGMVLVDPSIPDQRARFTKASPAFAAVIDQYNAQSVAVLDRCIEGLNSGKLKPGLADPDGCWSYPADYPPALTATLIERDTNRLRFAASRSYFGNFGTSFEQVVKSNRSFKNMPLIVLTAGKMPSIPGLSEAAKAELPAFNAEWSRAHDELAALSSRGVNRVVPDASHYIQKDKPQVVVNAVREVLAAARR